uniref:NADH dehydrogenase [ubiquinone] 1 alpha subcomplex subunit 1 n=1 Tax=Vespula pensylvanica TaxID=30213 RepID=A0A834P9T7_VESPE|nr:hypothetical protein H0235_002337 [Vespula pensylvanica]
MWYEIFPTVAIIAAGLGLPHVATHYLCLQVYGTPMRRLLEEEWDLLMFMRDSRLCDRPQTAGKMGLENIPDD